MCNIANVSFVVAASTVEEAEGLLPKKADSTIETSFSLMGTVNIKYAPLIILSQPYVCDENHHIVGRQKEAMRFRIYKASANASISALVISLTKQDGREAQEILEVTRDEFDALTDQLIEKLSSTIDNVVIFATEQI